MLHGNAGAHICALRLWELRLWSCGFGGCGFGATPFAAAALAAVPSAVTPLEAAALGPQLWWPLTSRMRLSQLLTVLRTRGYVLYKNQEKPVCYFSIPHRFWKSAHRSLCILPNISQCFRGFVKFGPSALDAAEKLLQIMAGRCLSIVLPQSGVLLIFLEGIWSVNSTFF